MDVIYMVTWKQRGLQGTSFEFYRFITHHVYERDHPGRPRRRAHPRSLHGVKVTD